MWCTRRPPLPARLELLVDIRVRDGASLTEGSVLLAAQASKDDEVVLDLRGATFVDPLGLVALAVAAEDAAAKGQIVSFYPPHRSGPLRYLARMHLDQAMSGYGINCSLPSVNEWNVGDRLMELRRFHRSDDEDVLASQVYRILESDDPEDAATLFRCVSEAVDNVCEHSGVEGGWAALQQYDEGGKKKIAFAVGDAGIGLRASLSRAVEIDDDSDAIRRAVVKGVSGTGDATRGEGLADLIDRVRERTGYVRLWSGDASAHTGAPANSLYTKLHSFVNDGTIIYATLNYG